MTGEGVDGGLMVAICWYHFSGYILRTNLKSLWYRDPDAMGSPPFFFLPFHRHGKVTIFMGRSCLWVDKDGDRKKIFGEGLFVVR
jgi:hypothetical protein